MAAGIVENAIAAAKSGAVKFDVLAGYKPSQEKLDQRRILITGGASGIGAALCKEFAQGSAWVVIADRDEALGRELEKELTSAGLK